MSVGSNFVHSFPITQGDRYHINVDVLGMDGRMHTINILADTGNDITLITRETAEDKLGINPDTINASTRFPVYGITDKPVYAREINNKVKIGKLPDIWIPMGIVEERGAFAEDLLGRRGLLDSGRFSINYDDDSVDFRFKPSQQMVQGDGNDYAANLFKPGKNEIDQVEQEQESYYAYYYY